MLRQRWQPAASEVQVSYLPASCNGCLRLVHVVGGEQDVGWRIRAQRQRYVLVAACLHLW